LAHPLNYLWRNPLALESADSCLTVSSQLMSLGVIFDPRLTFEACNYHIWALRHIRRVGLLPQDVAKTLASSIVSSRLDYCNVVLCGTPNSTTSKLIEGAELSRSRRPATAEVLSRTTFTEIITLASNISADQLRTGNFGFQDTVYFAT